MFENISQGLFTVGFAGALFVVPALRFLAAGLMALSTYRLLKARQDGHKFLWILAIFMAPILTRLAYEFYRRRINPKDCRSSGSRPLLAASIVLLILSGLLSAVSSLSMGMGYVKSELDGEFLDTFYDVHGNEYGNVHDIPLFDRDGNTYTRELGWFGASTYTDQNGRTYDGADCYLSEDGYFFHDGAQALVPYGDSLDYYTDRETIYYHLFNYVYWEEDGTIYELSGSWHRELFP